MNTIVESADLVVVTRYTRGVIGPSLGTAGTVRDGGRIRTVTPPGCWGPMITPRLRASAAAASMMSSPRVRRASTHP